MAMSRARMTPVRHTNTIWKYGESVIIDLGKKEFK